ncbi:MAG: prepilin peptidase [Lachnospiraceae bacterium]|nr:prepilin peptidase [Lachnospiraceae bacterium]
MDVKYDRIYNGWITLGILLGLSLRIWKCGWHDMDSAVAAMLLAFCILYPIYRISALGAGDVKLFIMVGSFLSVNRLLHVMVVSFIIGAVFSLGKMISEANFMERMKYLSSYLRDVLRSGQWKLYGENLKDDFKKYKSNKIHFALPICLSVMLGLGGMF